MLVLSDYEGRPVWLTDERGRHIEEHPEMASMQEAIAETLRQPEIVIQPASDPLARLHDHFYHRTIVGGKHFCGVVKVRQQDAFVVTAYLTDRVNKGTALWPRES